MNNAELLYRAIELHRFEPIDVWNRLSYAAKMLYCERATESGSWKKLPEYIIEYVEDGGATRITNGTTTVAME